MTARSFLLDDRLEAYVAAHNPPVDSIAAELIAETHTLAQAGMQIGPDQAAFMSLVTQLVKPSFAIEVGTFTGYSALTIARAMGPQGRLLCCDVNEEWTSMGRKYWERAGVAERIELKIAPALETLNALPSDRHVDLAFIDADKPNYTNYYEALIPRMTIGGLIMVDNVLWSGEVVAPSDSENTQALQSFNDNVQTDTRVTQVLLPIADGLSLIHVHG